jgi:hypothetical protein
MTINEATYLYKALDIENLELQRRNDELKTTALAFSSREEELVQIIQQALEEHESMTPRISKALYRRIEHWAPNIIKELPRAIDPFGDVITHTRNSSSVPSPDPLPGSSPSHRVFDVANNIFLTNMPVPRTPKMPRPFLPRKAIAGNTQHQYRHESSLMHNMRAGTPSSEPDSRQPQETAMPMQPPSAHLTSPFARISTDFPSDNWESAAFQPQDTMSENSALYNMDSSESQILNDLFHPQEPNVWDDSLFTGLLSTSAHGEESVNDNFLGDFQQ